MTSKQKSSGNSAKRRQLIRRGEGREETGRRESPGGKHPVIPDAEEGVNGEEHAPGRDRVVVQRLCKWQQIGAERRGNQAEEPRPVAECQAIEQANEQDEKDPVRNDVQEHDDRLEVKNVSRPFRGVFGRLEHALYLVRRIGVGLLSPALLALLAKPPGRGELRSPSARDRECPAIRVGKSAGLLE